MNLADAIRSVLMADTDEEMFGITDPAGRYRRLVGVLHPDRVVDAAQRDLATEAFVRVTTRWRARRDPVTRDPVTLRTTRAEYRLGHLAYAGDLADLYDVGAARLVKLPRDPANNDLMEREARALRRIAERGDPRYLPYVPRLVDSFRHRDTKTGAERRGNVVAAAPGLRSLVEVKAAYPAGVDPRDAAWMWRRLLVALGLAHRAGVVHGAVVPEHVLVEPDGHGVVLVDWCYAATHPGEAVPALVPGYVDWYPPEVPNREEPGPGTDIAMATRCMTYLIGAALPRSLRAFADGCLQPSPRHRPDDAWRLLGELDDVLERLYGPRTFRPFTPS